MMTKRAVCAVLLLLCLPLVLQAQEKVDLNLALSQGQSFKIALATSNSSSTTINGKPVNTTETLRFGLQFSVLEVTSDGSCRLKATFESPSYSVSGTEQGLEVMSGILNKAFAAISGRSFNIELSRAGQVRSVSGLESAIQAATQTVASFPEPGRQIVEALITQGLSEANWRQGLAEVFFVLPDGPVAIGERWSRKLSVGGQWTSVQCDVYFKITERSNGVARIKVYQDIKSLEKSLPIGIRYSLSGTSEGVLDVEEATGLILQGTLKSSMKGKASAADTGGKSVPLTITGTTSITRS